MVYYTKCPIIIRGFLYEIYYVCLVQVIDGMKVMGMTMGGLPILPYIVADMMHPHKAKVIRGRT